jgi:hypothetical protein
MNIIYLECKLLGITKCGFDHIGMSGCRRRQAAGGSALCFLLCPIKMTMAASSIQMKNSSHFSF